ncbi:MAG: DUF790 family protein [Myxococcota bacterium]
MALLPTALCKLCLELDGQRLRPRLFSARDLPWLRLLLDEYTALVGQKRTRLRERLREPLGLRASVAKLRVANHLLENLCRGRVHAAVPAREARWQVFRAAAGSNLTREQILEQVASSLAISPPELELSLFADLSAERRVTPLPSGFTAESFLAEANQAIVEALLARASMLWLKLEHGTGPIARRARALGLICCVQRRNSLATDALEAMRAEDAARLEVSGPLALFHHTQLYARALAALWPSLARCEQFELEADCIISKSLRGRLYLSSADAIEVPLPRPEPSNAVHARFAREFQAATRAWELHEVNALLSGEHGLFVDFLLVHRTQPERRFWLQIASFWTPEHVGRSLQALPELIVCVDAGRCCGKQETALGERCLPFKSRIDVARVLALIEAARNCAVPAVGSGR